MKQKKLRGGSEGGQQQVAAPLSVEPVKVPQIKDTLQRVDALLAPKHAVSVCSICWAAGASVKQAARCTYPNREDVYVEEED